MQKYNWLRPDISRIAAATASGRGFDDLPGRSPAPLNPGHTPLHYLQALLGATPPDFVCLARDDPRTGETLLWDEIDPAARPSLVVPSLMNAREGVNQEGRVSKRCASMITKRLYLVIETDFRADESGAAPTPIGELLKANPRLPTPKELSAGVAHHWLDLGWPVALVLFSGGKSCHTWLATWQDEDDEQAAKMFRYATALGADPALWTTCQLVRCPEGRREDGREQPVLYCNPDFMLGELPVINY